MHRFGFLLVPLVLLCGGLSAQYVATQVANNHAALDISATGTNQTANFVAGGTFDPPDEGKIDNVAIGFTFDFYGNSFTTLDISANGYLTFDDITYNSFTLPAGTPNATAPNNYIAGVWDDLGADTGNLPAGAAVFTETLGTAPNREFRVQFVLWPEYNGVNANDFIYRLFETSNAIEVHFGTCSSFGNGGAVTGVEDATASDGTASAGGFNRTTTPTQADRFDPPVVNDPEIDIQRPAGAANSIPSTTTDNVGSIPTGGPVTFTWTVENQGAANNLNITSIGAAPSGVANVTVTATPTLVPSGAIAPSGTASFDVDITPTAGGPFEFTITVANDDANENPYTIIVQGNGVAPLTLPFLENFDTWTTDITNPVPLPSDWFNDPNDGGAQDWYIDVGGTTSTGTGPTVDQSTGTATGVYLYVEDSNAQNLTGDVTMLSPLIDLAGAVSPLLSFWVHANDNNGVGVSNNTLHVDIIDVTASTTTADVVTPIQHIPDATLSIWTQFTADLSAFAGNIIRVQFRVDDAGNTFTHDIAIDTVEITDPPEMAVLRGVTAVADGGTDNVDILAAGSNLTYTIENNGAVDLNLTGTPEVVVVPGTNVATATVTTAPTTPVSASGSTTFVINVTAIAGGAYDFTVSIDNDDPDENPYNFTVSGNAVANVPPAVTVGAGNWVNAGGGLFTLTLNPGDAINDTLTADDATPDNMTVTVTAPGTALTGLTTQPTDITTPTAGPISLTWTGTANGSNAPGNYDWGIAIDDGTTTTNITARIIINDVAPTHTIQNASGGDGSTGSPYTSAFAVGQTGASSVDLASVTDANTGQTVTIDASVTPNPNQTSGPTGGTGFQFTLAGGFLTVAPAGTLAAGDIGTQVFDVTITDGTSQVVITVSLDVVANVPPVVANQTGSNWVNAGGGVFTLTLNPGDTIGDTLEATDATPDNMTVTVTAPGTALTTLTAQPTDVTTPTAGPIALTWTGTADASNAPGNYDWAIAISDGTSTTNITARIIITDAVPQHVAATGISGDGSGGTPYLTDFAENDPVTVNVNLANVTDANTGQTLNLSNVVRTGGTAVGGSGFTFSLVGGVLSVAPSATLVANDVGTNIYTMDVDDGTNTVVINVTITVFGNSGSVTFTTTSPLPNGTVGSAYGPVALAATGGTGPYTFTLANGTTLPAGLTLVGANISGTPTTAGTVTFDVRVVDSLNDSAVSTFQITINTSGGNNDGGDGDDDGGCSTGTNGFNWLALLGLLGVVALAFRARAAKA